MAMIRPTRDEVSDRFPVLGFTVQTGGDPYFEVMLTTDPTLPREKRTPENFYSTRTGGPLVAERGEAVFLAPTSVMQRFRQAGAEKIFYGLATFPDRTRSRVDYVRAPVQQSPYVNLRSYSGRGTRRIQLGATSRDGRRNGGGAYAGGTEELTWAGDQAQPGLETIQPNAPAATPGNGSAAGRGAPGNGQAPPAAQSAALSYDDGFGPMPTQPRPVPLEGSSVEIASAVAGAVMSRILDNAGDVSWELDQLRGLKHPHDNPAEAGEGTYNTTTITVPGPQIENLLTDQISAAFEIRFQYNGHSLGNIEITNTGTNDAVGWGLQVKANIMNDANVYDGRAAINVRFYYRFTRSIGSDQIGIYDFKLHADGHFDQNFRWTQSSSMAQGQGQRLAAGSVRLRAARTAGTGSAGQACRAVPPPPPRSRALTGAEAAIAIGGVLLEHLVSNAGDISWNLDQFRGIKHPNDVAPSPVAPFQDAPTIRLADWPKFDVGGLDEISAAFTIDWQFNGRSLGNVVITNVGTNDAAGWGLEVRAQIMDDNRVYPPADCAALKVRFHYRFTAIVGSDRIAITDVHLYGDGTYEQSGRWEQNTFL